MAGVTLPPGSQSPSTRKEARPSSLTLYLTSYGRAGLPFTADALALEAPRLGLREYTGLDRWRSATVLECTEGEERGRVGGRSSSFLW